MNRRIAYLYILIVFLLVGSYLFYQGAKFGVAKYKRSKNMELALKSAYHFGYLDGREHRREDWDNGGEEVSQLFCTNCVSPTICGNFLQEEISHGILFVPMSECK